MTEDYRQRIKENLENTLDSGYIPELGKHRSGKVRDIHFQEDKLVMVASDRVSAFDHILDKRIPFKGRILNLLNNWAFQNTKDIVPNASLDSPHPNVLVQKYCKNLMIECVVRGYVWGSMAADYEKGKREICGLKLPSGLLRYQKLSEPLFTPTTKSEHDEPMTFEEVAKLLGKELAEKVRETSIRLYEHGAKLASDQGLLFLDTKYEFGLDIEGNLLLIDEANTPDSSRYCTAEEYEKFKAIEEEMSTGKHKDVSELLSQKPELKIQELSKQFVRDVLTEKGFSYGSKGKIPTLDEEDIIEVAYRYVRLYELLTGNTFEFPEKNVKTDLLENLQKSGYIKGGLAVVIAGSGSDVSHIQDIQNELGKYSVPSEVRICSAHKQPASCESIIKLYNNSLEPVVFVSVAGGTDALSGVVSFHSAHPVISCPPDADNYESCLSNPPGSANSFILRPTNVAKHVAQILGHNNFDFQKIILDRNAEKILNLERADEKFRTGK